ncbi:hypothetical protein H4217_008647, partial [Coemansia sp. RSA 1939]
ARRICAGLLLFLPQLLLVLSMFRCRCRLFTSRARWRRVLLGSAPATTSSSSSSSSSMSSSSTITRLAAPLRPTPLLRTS